MPWRKTREMRLLARTSATEVRIIANMQKRTQQAMKYFGFLATRSRDSEMFDKESGSSSL